MTTSRGTGMMERILGSLMGLPLDESMALLPRWMEGADPRRKVAMFTAWMNAEKDTRLKRTLFVAWMAAERKNEKFLKDICVKASAVYVTEGFARAQCVEDRGLDDEGVRARHDADAGRSREHGEE